MLSYKELTDILKENDINAEEFSKKHIAEIYGKNIDDTETNALIQEMVLAVVDFDTPLYDILAYANDFESKLGLEEDTFVCDILDIVISNLKICKENAERLFALIEDADILTAYNTLMQDYKQFLSEKQITMLTELASKTFDNGLLF